MPVPNHLYDIPPTAIMAAVSPSSSPRLPSPPPMAEDQLGPVSPGVSLFDDGNKFPSITSVNAGASRRIRPGTRAEDMAEGPPLIELSDIDSAFQLTEHLKALHYSHTHPPDSHTIQPITADVVRELCQPPAGTSKDIWLYELGRFLIQKTNAIIIALFSDSPPCSAQTCPEMRASEWQYLCAVHDPPKSCSAIDYCCHTLDWAANILTSSKMFPSRLGLGAGSSMMGGDKVLAAQMKEIKNIFRRVYRIYAHAWFQHREVFWRVEGKTGLYVFFKAVCDMYGIIESDNYTIPPEAEGQVPPEREKDEPETPGTAVEPPRLLQRGDQIGSDGQEPMGNTVVSIGDTTKRHRHTMSDRASSVSTVIQEENEEEEEQEEKAPKPGLGRQSTALKDVPESPDVEVKEEEVEPSPEEKPEPPVPERQDTLKPEDVAGGDEWPEEVEEQTVIEADDEKLDTTEVKKEEEAGETTAQEAEQVPDEPAAKAEEAEKSVGD